MKIKIMVVNLGRVLLGLFQNMNAWNRRCLCSFGSNSVFGMNGISFPSFCSQQQNEQNQRNAAYSE